MLFDSLFSSFFDEVIKKWGPVVITFTIGLIGFTYKMTINEPRAIDKIAEQYLDRLVNVGLKLELMTEFASIYTDECIPLFSDIGELLTKATLSSENST